MTSPPAARLLVLLAAAACSRDEPARPPVKLGAAAPSQRGALASYRPLVDEVERAELDAGGLFIDFGTDDEHKYTRGGWRSGWGGREAALDTGAPVTFTEMIDRRAWLDLPAGRSDTPVAVIVRARSSVPGQTLTLRLGRRVIGTVPLAPVWLFVRAELEPDAVPRKSFRLEIRAARTRSVGPYAEIDWLWLSSDPAREPPSPGPRVSALAIHDVVERTIAAPGPRTYSFYLRPPHGATFIADLGASQRATFSLSVAADGEPAVELLRETVSGSWREQALSLERFGGRPIRLDLTTSDQAGEAGWGEPAIALARGAVAEQHPPLAARRAAFTAGGARARGWADLEALVAEAADPTATAATRSIARRRWEVRLGAALSAPEVAARLRSLDGSAGAGSSAVPRQLQALGYLEPLPPPGVTRHRKR